jgi:hypothetical protein
MPQPLHADLIDIERHTIRDFRSEGGELLVLVDWCSRTPIVWLERGSRREVVQWGYGPCVTTELHVLDDYVTVCNGPVDRRVESVLVAYVAGLFAADEEVAA